MRALVLPLFLISACCLFAGCGPDTVEGSDSSPDVAISAIQRSSDPRLLEARAALDAGRPSTAESLLKSIGNSAGVEGPLALARVSLAQGEVVVALRYVESARKLGPEDARVFATAAEILALADRGMDATDQLEAGRVLAPGSPDLARAQAFLELTRPGQAPMALKCLLAALEADPALPYCRWPMAQAHLLTGRGFLGAGNGEGAVAEANLALGLEPGLATAEELLGSGLAILKRFGPAIEALERAMDLGLDVTGQLIEVHLRTAMGARLLGKLEVAEDHYLAIRELGASEEELGSGLDFLDARGRKAFESGMQASLRDDHSAAAAAYARSLLLAPVGSLALDAMDGLAGARFRSQDYLGAGLAWSDLRSIEIEQGLLFESRTHLNIARSRVLSGDFESARKVLEQALSGSIDEAIAETTRELLARVPQK